MVSPEMLASAKAAVRPLTIKDLRVQCRSRGISPAGGRDTLAARLEEHMAATGDFEIKAELSQPNPADAAATYGSSLLSGGHYSVRHDRRELAPPPPPPAPRALTSTAAAPFSTEDNDRLSAPNNNYARPAGQQNVGNHLTGRNSSRVLCPPGGRSSIVFGDDDVGSRPSSSASGASARGAAAASRAALEQQQLEEERFEEGGAAEEEGVGGDESRFDEGGQRESLVAAAPAVPDAPFARVGVAGIGASPKSSSGRPNNNYARSEGQNVGNYLTGRNSSRVLQPPGGATSITFG